MPLVLVIDDSASAIQKVKDVLRPAGFEVEGLDLVIHLPKIVKENPPDLILLDLSMPALSGINVATFIRRYESKPIPILVYSSRPRQELVTVAKDLGAAGYVQKGDPDHLLIQAVRTALHSRPVSAR